MANFKCNKPYSTSWNGVKSKYEVNPNTSRPLPPKNVFVTTPYIQGILDIRWDNPLNSAENSQWDILGVNLYRSENSECGPYEKININPIEVLYYRDKTSHQLVTNENVMPTLKKGTGSAIDWVFTVQNGPIIKEGSQNELADSWKDVVVKIDNGDGQLINVPVKKVNGRTKEVFLITNKIYDPVTKDYVEPRLPIAPNSRVYCSYWYNTNFIRSDLIPRFFYKVTTVGRGKDGSLLETSLEDVMPANVYQIEKPHYIWKAIIAKNRYLLEQLGERAKLFIRKEVGERCITHVDTHGQSHNHCKLCFGTGYIGGFEGPFDILIAPPEAEKHIDLTDTGLRLNFTYESWTGPSPLIRTRDFIVRQNFERMIIGSVTPQGAKGSIFQQHFTLNYRDTKDIIYQVPVEGGEVNVPVADDTRNVNQPVTPASPIIPAHKSKRAETDKGRTIDYENVVW